MSKCLFGLIGKPLNKISDCQELEGNFRRFDKQTGFNLSARPRTAGFLCTQVAAGLHRREVKTIAQIFEKHKDHSSDCILPDKLACALDAIGLVLKDEELKEAFVSCDLDEKGGLDSNEFARFVCQPCPMEEFAQTLPLAQLLGDAFPREPGKEPQELLSGLNDAHLRAVARAMAEGLTTVLCRCRDELLAATANGLNCGDTGAVSKFSVVPEMSAGSIEDFYSGLSGRMGYADLRFEYAMELEHTLRAGCEHTFTTRNYGVTTTPAAEWRGIFRGDVAGLDMQHGRRMPVMAELMKLRTVREAGLLDFEVGAVVLYTGPMFAVYNCVLRRFPQELFEVFAAGDNLFPTTIHVLASAVQKLARATRLPPDGLRLYRGLGGMMDLPQSFRTADARGVRGFAEWGFMSTTSRREVATRYSGAAEGRPRAAVLVIRAGPVDRGACVRELSQYPAEVEYLYVPCSFLAPDGPAYVELSAHGAVRMVPARLSANLAGAATVEAMLGRKKQIHVTGFEYGLEELRLRLAARLDSDEVRLRAARDAWTGKVPRDLVESVVGEAREWLDRHRRAPAERYVDPSVFRVLNQEMRDALRFAEGKFQLWLEDPIQHLESMTDRVKRPLRTCFRLGLALLERRAAAGAVGGAAAEADRRAAALEWCRRRDLVGAAVEERNEIDEPRLIEAAADGASSKCLRMLVAAGADVECSSEKGRTAVYKAAQFGQAEAVEELARLGADVCRANDSQATPVLIAAQNGQADAIAALQRLGADLRRRDKDGWTPAYAAALSGFPDCIRLLSRLGADVCTTSTAGMAPVHVAAAGGHAECLRALAEARADLAARNAAGKTAAELAEEKGMQVCLEVLRQLS